uniref:Uncharacterized protein n=1 Tax=Peronospora matthiolae TaxID=2874970 RepID=A0AAV1U3D8_9STRA
MGGRPSAGSFGRAESTSAGAVLTAVTTGEYLTPDVTGAESTGGEVDRVVKTASPAFMNDEDFGEPGGKVTLQLVQLEQRLMPRMQVLAKQEKEQDPQAVSRIQTFSLSNLCTVEQVQGAAVAKRLSEMMDVRVVDPDGHGISRLGKGLETGGFQREGSAVGPKRDERLRLLFTGFNRPTVPIKRYDMDRS